MNLLKIFVFFSFTILSLSAQSSESEKIYKSILKATFTNDKIEIAQNLLKKNECKETNIQELTGANGDPISLLLTQVQGNSLGVSQSTADDDD